MYKSRISFWRRAVIKFYDSATHMELQSGPDSQKSSANPESEAPRATGPIARLIRDKRGAVPAVVAAVLSLAGYVWQGTEFVAVVIDRFEKIEGGIKRMPIPPDTATEKNTVERVKPRERSIPAIPECSDAKTITDAIDLIGSPPMDSMQALFTSKLKGKVLCSPGWPAIVESVSRNASGGSPIFLVVDPENPKRKFRFDANMEALEYRDGAPVWVSMAQLEGMDDRGYIIGRAGRISSRKADVKSKYRVQKNTEKKSEPPPSRFWNDLFSPMPAVNKGVSKDER